MVFLHRNTEKITMNLLKAFFGIFTAGILSFAAGCTTITELPAKQQEKDFNTAELKLCRQLLIAFVKNDASSFTRLLTEENRKSFNMDEFNSARENMLKTVGEPISFRYLTTLEFVALQPHIWVVRFKRRDIAQKKEFTSEALFRIVTGKDKQGKIYVLGFNFI